MTEVVFTMWYAIYIYALKHVVICTAECADAQNAGWG